MSTTPSPILLPDIPTDLPFGELVHLLETTFPGEKGWAITQALRYSGYVRDPNAFLADYEAGRKTIDDYLAHLDTARLAEDMAKPAAREETARQYGPTLAAGLAAGALGTLLVQRFIN